MNSRFVLALLVVVFALVACVTAAPNRVLMRFGKRSPVPLDEADFAPYRYSAYKAMYNPMMALGGEAGDLEM